MALLGQGMKWRFDMLAPDGLQPISGLFEGYHI